MAEKGAADDDLFEVSEEALLSTDFDDDAEFEPEEEEYDPNELDELAGDADIPLEQLRAMYGYGMPQDTDEAAVADSVDSAGGYEDVAASGGAVSVDASAVAGDSEWQEPRGADLMALVGGGHATSAADQEVMADEDDEEDEDYKPAPPSPTLDWRREIRQGDEYQAVVPDSVEDSSQGSDTEMIEEPVWQPGHIEESQVQNYLLAARNAELKEITSVQGRRYAPDNETALRHLATCGFNTELALESLPEEPKIETWSEDECSRFEEGLSQYGKNFYHIQREKVPERTVAELIHFFYVWKKTERYDYFRRTNPARVFSGRHNVYPVAGDLSTAADSSDAVTNEQTSAPRICSPIAQSASSDLRESNGKQLSAATDGVASHSPLTLPTLIVRPPSCTPADEEGGSTNLSSVEPTAKRPYSIS